MTNFSIKNNAHRVADKQNRTPPYALEAEQSVLGGLLLDKHAWDKVAGHVISQDFYKKEHQVLFSILAYLFEQGSPVDTVLVKEALQSRSLLDKAGGEAYLYTLQNEVPTATNIVAYADIVRDKAILRETLAMANEIVQSIYQPEGRSSQVILEEAESKILSIGQRRDKGKGLLPISDIIPKAMDRIHAMQASSDNLMGISTGFSDLDRMTAGLQSGELVIIAGRPSMGKTAFSMNIAEHVIFNDKKSALIFSMEMPGEMLATRLLSSLTRVNQNKLRTGKLEDQDWEKLMKKANILSETKLFIDDTAALSPAELCARVRRFNREHKNLGLVVIDYIQLMKVSGFTENRNLEVSEISRSFKILAKEMDVPVIVLSQLNRGLEQRSDKRPIMSDIRESGAIEQDADLIIFIYRDEVYNPDKQDKKGIAEIIIAKQRNGPIGKVDLTFLGKFTRFENYVADPSEAFQLAKDYKPEAFSPDPSSFRDPLR